MVNKTRNIQFLSLIVLPIMGFVLGWVLHGRATETGHSLGSFSEAPVAQETTIEVKPAEKPKNPRDTDLSQLWEVWSTLEQNYLRADTMNADDQLTGAIKGLVYSTRDPYTQFFTPEENKSFQDTIRGDFTGIGAEVEQRDGVILIVAPLKGSPAEGAGLQAGDVITQIDGTTTDDMDILEAVGKIKGKKGTPVDLHVRRDDAEDELLITIVRDKITIQPVEWRMIDMPTPEATDDETDETADAPRIAYISVSQFTTNLETLFDDVAADVLLENPDGIVLDLRNNGGGDLEACIEVLRHFLRQKLVVQTQGTAANQEQFKTDRSGVLVPVPLAVLVNGGSASASEVFAGALQDHARAVVLGQQTFGKGLVQEVFGLSGGASLKITTMEWLTPRGRQIDKVGIAPDLELTDEELEGDAAITRAAEVLTGDYAEWLERRRQTNKALDTDTNTADAE